MATTNAKDSRAQGNYHYNNGAYVKPLDKGFRNGYSNRARNNYMDEDEDEDRKIPRGHKVSDNKPKNQLEQSDKIEISKRLEREKKIIQKKQRDEEVEKPIRFSMKQKKNTKSALTKAYVIGRINEDDDDLLY